MTQISLNGSDWLFKGFEGEDWRWRNSHKPDTRDVRWWRKGTVPGSVYQDLWSAGEIPDPYFERNTLLAEWVADRTWLYKRTFTVPEEYRGKRLQLRFEGVDYEAQFFLNGGLLGYHRGMYTPAVFDVGDRLDYGAGQDNQNLIAVVIERAPDEQPQVGRTSMVRTHKSRMTYWWDFCPRLVQLGIWEGVYLDVTGPVRIEDVFVRPQLSGDLKRADVPVSVELSASGHTDVEVEITIRRDKTVIGSQRSLQVIRQSHARVDLTFEVNDPQLWWPNGHGEQSLYTADVRVIEPGGDESDSRESDSREVTFGIRRIVFTPNETPDPTARSYVLTINGEQMYIKGWNWVPIDVMYGVERPAKLERLMILARRANVNLLRVWGGGLIEREAFYNWCDRLGIMVWQEFIQSSSGIDNDVSRDRDTIAMLTGEAEQIIPRKRNHPSLAIWCGGNELQAGPEQPLDDSHPALAALHSVVERLDPDRLWLPTSSSGRVFSNSLEAIERDPLALHDVHGPWEHQGLVGQYTLYNRSTSLLHSEFGAEGITNLRTLNKTVSEANRWPVNLDNAVWQHLGAWWVKERQWRESLGDVSDLETLQRATQYLQAEGVRYAVEADRRRQYQNSGTLPWQFNEPYPMAACTSAVDYYGQPKPLYYAVARAYEPLHVSAKFRAQTWKDEPQFDAEIWVSNSYADRFENATLEMRLVGASGRVYAIQTARPSLPGNASTKAADFSCPLAGVEDIFFLDLYLWTVETISSQNRYLFVCAENLAPALVQPPTTLEVRPNARSGFVTISNTGVHTAFFVWLEDTRELPAEGYVYFDDNHMCIFPNESKTIAVAWTPDVPPGERRVAVKGWNTELVYF